MFRPLATIAAALFSVALVSPASAEPTEPTKKIAFRLDYQPAEDAGCPNAEELGYTLAGEFGYLVVRHDATALVRIDVRLVDDGVEAFVWAPDVSGEHETWHGQTDPQTTCRELSYDIASLLGAHLGPKAWPSDEPPAMLAAPPELEVGRPALWPHEPRMPETLLPGLPRQLEDVGLSSKNAPSFRPQVGAFALVMPSGLTSVGIGGSAVFIARWSVFALGGEFRAFVTPADGIGEPPQPGRSSLVGAALVPCMFVPYVDFCAVAALNNIDFDLPSSVRLSTRDGLTFGIGARVVGKWPVTNRLDLAGFGELTGDLRRISLRWQYEDGTSTGYFWPSPRFRVIAGVGVLFSAF